VQEAPLSQENVMVERSWLLRAEIAKRAVMAHAIGHRCGSGLGLRVGSRLCVDPHARSSLLAATPLMVVSGSPYLSAECAT
jgi:hypothetical protein